MNYSTTQVNKIRCLGTQSVFEYKRKGASDQRDPFLI
jgi:hypothetical protein